MKSFFKLLAVVFVMTIIGCEKQELSDETTIEFQTIDKDQVQSPDPEDE